MAKWRIEGRDVYIQDWETREEMAVWEAEKRLNKFIQLETENKELIDLLVAIKEAGLIHDDVMLVLLQSDGVGTYGILAQEAVDDILNRVR